METLIIGSKTAPIEVKLENQQIAELLAKLGMPEGKTERMFIFMDNLTKLKQELAAIGISMTFSINIEGLDRNELKEG